MKTQLRVVIKEDHNSHMKQVELSIRKFPAPGPFL